MNEIRKKIIEAEEKVKYNYKIDKKCNRGLCNQTIYGTREKDGKYTKLVHTIYMMIKNAIL